MGILSIVLINLFIREIEVYGNKYISKEYILSFFPLKKEIDSFNSKYYENKLFETGNFDYVLIDKKGNDTIDIFVILKEKNRFNFSFTSSITPNNKYTFGFEIMDRFFLNREQKIKFKFYILNMKKIEILWYSFKKNFSPILFLNYSNYKHPENFIFEEYIPLSGIYYKRENFNFFLLSGTSFIKAEHLFEKTLRACILTGFSKNYMQNSIFSLFDFYSTKKKFISNFIESKINFKLLFFNFVPSFKIFFQGGEVPFYRKIYLGGYKCMKSFEFGEFIGENAQIYEIYLYYNIFSGTKNRSFLNIFLFGEIGNAFDNLNEWKNKRLHKGIGAGISLSFNNEEIELFFSLNEKKKIKFGIRPKLNKIFPF